MSNEKFDMVIFRIGYQKYVVDRKAGMALFDLFTNTEVYRVEEKWISGVSGAQMHIAPASMDEYPTISTIGAVAFNTGRIAYDDYIAEKRKEEAAKKV